MASCESGVWTATALVHQLLGLVPPFDGGTEVRVPDEAYPDIAYTRSRPCFPERSTGVALRRAPRDFCRRLPFDQVA